MKIDLIQFMISKDGKLPSNLSWYDIGKMFGIEAPDQERANSDKEYETKSISTKANDIWRAHLKQQNKLELRKEVYEHGKLRTQTFVKESDPDKLPVDIEEYEVERITTNPNGGAWLKYKKKDIIFEDTHLEDLKKMLMEEITPIDYKPMINTNNLGLFIYSSDKHIGALTKDNSVYKNQYDKKEIVKRLVHHTIRNIEKSVRYFGNFEALYYMDLGDALDGFNQKTTRGLKGESSHDLPQQLNNREQHDIYVEVHKYLFDHLASKEYAKKLYYIATSNSNHGGDFEYGAMRNLETYLNVKYPSIKTTVTHYPFNHFIYGNHAIIFGHGKDDEDMKAGMPLNLNEKIEIYLSDYILKNNLNQYIITVVTGDLHQSSENYGKNFRYKKVLSQYGSTKWMHSNFGSGNPGLSFEIVDKHTPMIYRVDDFFHIGSEVNTGIKFND